jgi:hypothetical protein
MSLTDKKWSKPKPKKKKVKKWLSQ